MVCMAKFTADMEAIVQQATHESNLNAKQLYDRIAERTGFIQYRKQLS